jgi:hypothetical protein
MDELDVQRRRQEGSKRVINVLLRDLLVVLIDHLPEPCCPVLLNQELKVGFLCSNQAHEKACSNGGVYREAEKPLVECLVSIFIFLNFNILSSIVDLEIRVGECNCPEDDENRDVEDVLPDEHEPDLA